MQARAFLRRLWQGLRHVAGDDAYERYLAHRRAQHYQESEPPLTAAEFYKCEINRKWNQVRRCC
ncbi:MAG: CstA-like transporter-associated (seleno)protein [Gammaproteobacteria bacterium]